GCNGRHGQTFPFDRSGFAEIRADRKSDDGKLLNPHAPGLPDDRPRPKRSGKGLWCARGLSFRSPPPRSATFGKATSTEKARGALTPKPNRCVMRMKGSTLRPKPERTARERRRECVPSERPSAGGVPPPSRKA